MEARLREEVRPVWPVRLPSAGIDGVARRRGGVLERVLHRDGAPVLLRAAQPAPERVVLEARAATEELAAFGLARLRFWTAVDDDLAAFAEAFADDPLIGASVREAPWRRPFRRAMPFEALVNAVAEQLITDERAQELKRAVVRRHGPVHEPTGLRDLPDAATVAGLAPAELEACGFAAARARALVKAATEVAAGRVDLLTDDPEARVAGWRRLRAVPGIGAWTVSYVAMAGQGHHDALLAGDHEWQLLVGGGRRKAVEAEVTAFYERFRPWRGLAAWHHLMASRQTRP
jgi:3-methyladenine DNA glycosylase/8-oxoguanine DNA glycosylase